MQLFQRVFFRILGSANLNRKIILYEMHRLPANRLGRLTWFFTVLGGVEFIFMLPGCYIPFLHWLWRFPTILISAPVISREFEDDTWNTLRATSLSIREIVFQKYLAVLRYVEPRYMLMIYIRAVPLFISGIAWGISIVTVLPQRGFAYWFSTTLALLFSGGYLLLAPLLDSAFDAALGVMISAFCARRLTALPLAVLVRATGFLLPLILAVPLEYGVFNNLTGVDFMQLRALAVVSTFGPGYAFLWGVTPWLSILLVLGFVGGRLGLARLMLTVAVRQVENRES